MYACLTYENTLALRTSLETGLRIDDVLHLKTVDLKGRTIVGIAKKTGKPFKKVLSVDLAKRLKQISSKEWIFVGRFGNKPRTRQAVWKNVKKASKILELQGNIAPHSARKTYAVEDFKENGIGKVQKDLQHTDVNTTMLYAFADLIDTFPAVKGATAIKKNKNEHKKSSPEVDNMPTWATEFGVLVADIVYSKIENIIKTVV